MNSGSSVEMATKRDTFPGIALPLEGPRILPNKSLSGNKLLGILQQKIGQRRMPLHFGGIFCFQVLQQSMHQCDGCAPAPASPQPVSNIAGSNSQSS
jgi:hypothetical protein